jgi:hypothetical protein
VEAKQQVVAGMKYAIVMDAGLSSCLKTAPSHILSACPLTGSASRYTLTVVDRQWATPRYTLLTHAMADVPEDTNSNNNLGANGHGLPPTSQSGVCASSPTQMCKMMCQRTPTCPVGQCAMRQGSCCTFECQDIQHNLGQNGHGLPPAPTMPCAGCPSSVTVTPEAEAAALAGMERYNAALGLRASGTFQLVQVKSVTTQVVAGTLFKLTVVAGPTSCLDGTPSAAATPAVDRSRITAWIAQGVAKGTMNEYGDAPDTMYTGGSPLFDESTGEMRVLSEYVMAAHPSRPWDSLCTVEKADEKEFTMKVWDQPWRTPRYILQAHSLPEQPGAVASMLGNKHEGDANAQHDSEAKNETLGVVGGVFAMVVSAAVLVAVAAYGFKSMAGRNGALEGQAAAGEDLPDFEPLSNEEAGILVEGGLSKTSV